MRRWRLSVGLILDLRYGNGWSTRGKYYEENVQAHGEFKGGGIDMASLFYEQKHGYKVL